MLKSGFSKLWFCQCEKAWKTGWEIFLFLPSSPAFDLSLSTSIEVSTTGGMEAEWFLPSKTHPHFASTQTRRILGKVERRGS